ncbi:MAG TPA: SMC-Scp complex subunit ScpB [Thermoanaerobaculia bacterium]|nr:SMC-Scp complex subunit ScpB [Thermoanaerobaculia bacterium]
MEPTELRAALEAILFLSSDPVRVDDLAESLDETKDAVSAQLEEIKRNLDDRVGGFMLEQAAGGWRLTTRAEHDAVLKKYFAKKGENRLSLAALETLAIVAYRQPITAPEVSEIRGVNSTSPIRTLLERRMIRVAGRKNVVGSPFLYRTTKDFLVHFGLNDIRDLPRLEEFGDLIGENIGDDLVAAINAAPEPTGEGIIETPETNEGSEGTSFEESPGVASEETQLESSDVEATAETSHEAARDVPDEATPEATDETPREAVDETLSDAVDETPREAVDETIEE